MSAVLVEQCYLWSSQFSGGGAFVQIRMKHEWGTNWLEVPIKIEILAEIPKCSVFHFSRSPSLLATSESFIRVQENRLVPCQILTRKSLHRVHRLGNLTSLCPNLCICLESLSSPAILESKSFWLLICECSSVWCQNEWPGRNRAMYLAILWLCLVYLCQVGGLTIFTKNLPWISNTSSTQ